MRTVLGALAALLFLPAVALAQTGGGFDLSHNVIAGGGDTFSAGGEYELGGTIAQADAGRRTGGTFIVNGGFWSASLPGATPTPTATMTPPSTPTRTATVTRTPTVTRTGTVTRTPTITRTGTITRTPTRTTTASTAVIGDCTGDGQLTSQDISRLLQIFTRCPTCSSGGVAAGGCAAVSGTDKQCFSADRDGDGCITAGELARVLKAGSP